MGEAEARMAAIGNGTELAFVEKPRLPHLRSRRGREVHAEIPILVHGDLALAHRDTIGAKQPLHAGEAFLVDDAGEACIPRTIGNAFGPIFRHVDLMAGSVAQRSDETIEAGRFTCRYALYGQGFHQGVKVGEDTAWSTMRFMIDAATS